MSTRILIIDSDIDFSEQLSLAARMLGIDADTVPDGNEGIQLAQLDQPSAVVLGLMDTKGAGYGLCSKLRRRVPEVPVILVIDPAEEGSDRLERHRALRIRADAYLTRPFTAHKFVKTLNDLLKDPVDVPDVDLTQVLGEPSLISQDSLGGSLFDADELAEIEAEADSTFVALEKEASQLNPIELDIDDADIMIDIDDEGEGTQVLDMTVDLDALPAGNLASVADPEDDDEAGEDDEDGQEGGPEQPEYDADQFVADFADELAGEVDAELVDLDLEEVNSPIPAQAGDGGAVDPGLAPEISAAGERASEEYAADRDNRSLRAQVIELQQELKLAREDLSRRKSETANKRTTDSAARRELLDARDQLNRREREVLELRDKLSARDRQIIEVSEQTDELQAMIERLETQARSADAKQVAIQAAREEAEREVESLRVRLSETRVRLDKARAETEKTYNEIKAIQEKSTRDLKDLRDENKAAMADLKARHKSALAAAEAEAAEMLELQRAESESALADAAERAKAAAAAATEALDAANTAAAAELAENRSRHADALKAAKAEHAEALSAAEAQHADALNTTRKVHAEEVKGLEARLQALDSTLEQTKVDHAEFLEAMETEHKAATQAAAAAHAKALDEQHSAHEAAMAQAKGEWGEAKTELEGKLAAQVERAEGAEALAADRQTQVDQHKARISELEDNLEFERLRADEAGEELKATKQLVALEKRGRADDVGERDAKITDLQGELEDREARIASHERTIQALSEDVAARERDLSDKQDELVALGQVRDGVQAQLDAERENLRQRVASVEKARTALGVAQAFLEDAGLAEADGAEAELEA